MNPFLLSPDEQIAIWKNLREEIKQLDEQAALKRVAEYWSHAPLMKMAYDPEDCSDWLSPWEMINNSDWCAYSVAIGMEFTLRLAGWDAKRMRLLTIRDYDISDQKMILEIDKAFVLNYITGEVVPYPNTNHDVLVVFQNDGKRYCEIK